MKRIAVDTMIVTRIANTPGLVEKVLASAPRLRLVTTHITRDQLEAIKEPADRERLLTVYDSLPKEDVATGGFVLDVSRLDEAELCDEKSALTLEQLTTKGQGGIHDALIGLTARVKVGVLVTDDKELIKKVKRVLPECELWSFKQFVAFVTR